MASKITIKQILLSNQNWWRFFSKHKHTLRPSIVTTIIKLLSCKNKIRGSHHYRCSNPQCTHMKRVPHTCKCKACSSCGKKATELWVAKQNQLLPQTPWQHITFTMPDLLWDFFWFNRKLLNEIGKIAALCIQTIAKKKNIIPGIFIAIHTFGRDLKRNVHVHLSTTTGGLADENTQWKPLFFDQATLMRIWRYHLIALFRKSYQQASLIIPPALQKQFHPTFTFLHFLNQLYKKTWIVHCSPPSQDHLHNVRYLGRYIKRPAIAESKLKHYNGSEVSFNYFDHRSKTYRRFTLTVEQFITRFIQHIPDDGFRMIRYYGFLSHRLRGKLLPRVYQLLNQETPRLTTSLSYAILIYKNFNFHPLICILCGQPLILSSVSFGPSNARQLIPFHRQLALLQKI